MPHRTVHTMSRCFLYVGQVLADTLTLALMCYASLLDEDNDSDSEQLDYIYAGALIIQVMFLGGNTKYFTLESWWG